MYCIYSGSQRPFWGVPNASPNGFYEPGTFIAYFTLPIVIVQSTVLIGKPLGVETNRVFIKARPFVSG